MTTNNSLRETMMKFALYGNGFDQFLDWYRGSLKHEELVHQWNTAMFEINFEDELEVASNVGRTLKKVARMLRNLDNRGLDTELVAQIADMSEEDMLRLKAILGV